MTTLPWNVLSDSHNSQQLCSGDYWPKNDFLLSLQPPSSAWIITLGYIFLYSFLWKHYFHDSPDAQSRVPSYGGSCTSWNWLIMRQRSPNVCWALSLPRPSGPYVFSHLYVTHFLFFLPRNGLLHFLPLFKHIWLLQFAYLQMDSDRWSMSKSLSMNTWRLFFSPLPLQSVFPNFFEEPPGSACFLNRRPVSLTQILTHSFPVKSLCFWLTTSRFILTFRQLLETAQTL